MASCFFDLWLLDHTFKRSMPQEASSSCTYTESLPACACSHLISAGGSVASCFSDLWLLDTATLTWSIPRTVGAAVGSRAGHAGAVLGSQWVIVGGGNNVKGESSARRGGVMPLSAGRGV